MEIERPAIEILVSVEFQQSLRKLAKKYRNVRLDVEPIVQELENGNFVGDRIQGLGNVVVFKVRASNSDA
jgi:mRNA-degrading endonuclease RelE of RelBE toxin-antitoxin system